MTGKTMAAIDDVAAERKRQIEGEGYDAAHDDEHINGEIALAACCYAAPDLLFVKDDRANAIIMRDPWPWEERFDKRRYNGNVVLPMKPEHIEIAEQIARDASCAQGEFGQRVLSIIPYLTDVCDRAPSDHRREMTK
jgi:hypothetical protein